MSLYHNILIIGSPRSGTTRLHRLLVNHYAKNVGIHVPEQEIFNSNYYQNLGNVQKRFETVMHGKTYHVIKCLFEQLEFLADNEVELLFGAYDSIVHCMREDLHEQCISYAIAHHLSMKGMKRWNINFDEPTFKISPKSLTLNEIDITRFFDHYVHSFRILRLIPQHKVKILQYGESCQLGAKQLLEIVGIYDACANDVTVKLDSQSDKVDYILNIEQVSDWIAQNIERINNDFKL